MSKHLPWFDPSIIRDHNIDGYDSVDSEDFYPGYGCVPVYVERNPAPPPPIPVNESYKQNFEYFKKYHNEKNI
jgi:hypothetical protein